LRFVDHITSGIIIVGSTRDDGQRLTDSRQRAATTTADTPGAAPTGLPPTHRRRPTPKEIWPVTCSLYAGISSASWDNFSRGSDEPVGRYVMLEKGANLELPDLFKIVVQTKDGKPHTEETQSRVEQPAPGTAWPNMTSYFATSTPQTSKKFCWQTARARAGWRGQVTDQLGAAKTVRAAVHIAPEPHSRLFTLR
jgi:hypothetical protein